MKPTQQATSTDPHAQAIPMPRLSDDAVIQIHDFSTTCSISSRPAAATRSIASTPICPATVSSRTPTRTWTIRPSEASTIPPTNAARFNAGGVALGAHGGGYCAFATHVA